MAEGNPKRLEHFVRVTKLKLSQINFICDLMKILLLFKAKDMSVGNLFISLSTHFSELKI